MKKLSGTPPGRPKIKFTSSDLEKIERMAAIGLPNEKIGKVMGCSHDVLERDPEVLACLSKGRVTGDMAILNTAFEMAVKDKNPTMLIFLCKTRLKMSEAPIRVDSLNVHGHLEPQKEIDEVDRPYKLTAQEFKLFARVIGRAKAGIRPSLRMEMELNKQENWDDVDNKSTPS